ncbi:MucR family transcriptional regulator [Methylorubrum sp. POS3]|uniref:MucR family transcriptional regulator n=1 Tax=Methylorubrum sp. POS3 TaxID=2998492 RepID=UPI00372CA2C2
MSNNLPGNSSPDDRDKIADRVVSIVSAFVGNNTIPAKDLPALIANVHVTLANLDGRHGGTQITPSLEIPTQDQIKKSIGRDALISFIDGKPYKMLRRHLKQHDMTPESYRARYGLPQDYPMTAAEYSARRVAIAQANKPRPPRAQ